MTTFFRFIIKPSTSDGMGFLPHLSIPLTRARSARKPSAKSLYTALDSNPGLCELIRVMAQWPFGEGEL